MVVGDNKRSNIMDGIENAGDVRMHDHRLRLKQRFDIVRKLGQGTYGKVQLGINKKTGQEVAIKTIKKCKIESEADLVRIRREVQIMSSVRHPNIVHIYEVFENSEKMILVMEYCSGGELYDYLSEKKVLQEDEARRLFRQIATAVYYCHIHKICHRDLKLENVLLDDTGSAKIADFGLSNVFKETSLLSTFCGSPLYASPEIVKGTPYIGPEVDCWSLGVLLYTLVYGAMPFDGSNFKRLVKQISNGDYYEPKSPSSASPLIRDMLTVDPVKRADIAYICDHPWVNLSCELSCLEMAQTLAAETPVRLDLLLSLAPPAAANNSVVVPTEGGDGEQSGTDLSSYASMAVEPSNSAEKRILELVAEGGEDAIKPSPTRTIVSAGDNKRKLELAMSSSGLQKKKERVASSANLAQAAVLPEEGAIDEPPPTELEPAEDMEPQVQPTLKSSATITISPAPSELTKDATKEVVLEQPQPKEESPTKTGARPRVAIKKKTSPTKSVEKVSPEKAEDVKQEEPKPSPVAAATDKMTSLSLAQQTPAPPAAKPKKFSLPGGNVGSFKEQFERRASLTAPETKKTVSKPVVSKIAKPKAQSEDREMSNKTVENNSSVRLQQIGIEPPQSPPAEIHRTGVKKTESEPGSNTTPLDPSVLLQDARRSLQNSMAKLVEERHGDDSRRRAARDIISSAIRTGKPPMPYGRSSSAGVTSSLASPPATPPVPPPSAPRVFRTEAQHRVEDHRNRGVSVERIIPIAIAGEEPATPPPAARPTPPPQAAPLRPNHVPLRRLASNDSTGSGGSEASGGEPIRKSTREFIIPIAVEGQGYVRPRDPDSQPQPRPHRPARRLSNLVSGGESDEENDTHMHRLRSTRAARAESVSSGEEDEEDEGFHLLTAENLFSTLLHRVRALTNRLNGEEGPGFPQHAAHSLFNSPFFHSPHLPRRNLLREGWGSRDLHTDFDSMFNKSRTAIPRGSNKKTGKHQTKTQASNENEENLDLSDLDLSSIQLSEKEMQALSGLTPALSRRLQQQLLAHLPPAAARTLRRTLSLNAAAPHKQLPYQRSQSATKSTDPNKNQSNQPCINSTESNKNIVATNKEVDITDETITTSNNNVSIPFTNGDQTDNNSNISQQNLDNKVENDTSNRKTCDSNTSDTPAEVKTGITPPVITTSISPPEIKTSVSPPEIKTENLVIRDPVDVSIPHYSTLPRLKRRSISRETSPTIATSEVGYDYVPRFGREKNSRASSIRSTPDRSLLSKYLTPERTLSVDEPYSSDSGSILSEPSYIAAYGSPALGSFRRHSMRLPSDVSRKRVSRFLRPDFFDSPPDENLYTKQKKEKELETQKILQEIREKRNKSLGPTRAAIESNDLSSRDECGYSRKCLSPLNIISGKDRSRSITPFFPILDNIKETTLDTSSKPDPLQNTNTLLDQKEVFDRSPLNDCKIIRPKSYPVKTFDSIVTQPKSGLLETSFDTDSKDSTLSRESKLIRPKSYPASSPSPEKSYVRNPQKDDPNKAAIKNDSPEKATDVEVSFNITLPRKVKPVLQKSDSNKETSPKENETTLSDNSEKFEIKKDKVVDNDLTEKESKERKSENGVLKTNFTNEQNNCKEVENSKINVLSHESQNVEVKLKPVDSQNTENNCKEVENSKINVLNHESQNVEVKLKPVDSENTEKKGTIKKRIIKKVSSKAKSDLGRDSADLKTVTEKKKVIKKIKEKDSEDSAKKPTVKKKSVLQTIGQKFEKLTSNKSNSPEKAVTQTNSENSKESGKPNRNIREQSVPVETELSTESKLIKRATTLTDVAALDASNVPPNKTTVSKVLGLFKKSEPKEKQSKPPIEKNLCNNVPDNENSLISKDESAELCENVDKPKRPTSLLLNGLGRKKYGRSASDSVSTSTENNDNKEIDSKNPKSNLKLDFSRLPRVKKIVPTSPVIEPQFMMNIDKDDEKKAVLENNGLVQDDIEGVNRSRSRSRSVYSTTESKSENSGDFRRNLKSPTSPTEIVTHLPLRHHEATSPDKEDIMDRIRRKSFYSRFNEKKQKRKSNLVGPGAAEYDPVTRLHSQPTAAELLRDVSPTAQPVYDISPGHSSRSDISPCTEKYRPLLTDVPISTRRFDNYGAGSKVDTYRSLDRSDLRKYPGRPYLDYDQPLSYSANRYARTKSLLDSPDSAEDDSLSHLRSPLKYNRTISMYSPGNYATYRPNRTRNSAILLKDNEKEPSPENIIEKIKQRKKMAASAKLSTADNDPLISSRSTDSSQGEGNSAECSAKAD